MWLISIQSKLRIKFQNKFPLSYHISCLLDLFDLLWFCNLQDAKYEITFNESGLALVLSQHINLKKHDFLSFCHISKILFKTWIEFERLSAGPFTKDKLAKHIFVSIYYVSITARLIYFGEIEWRQFSRGNKTSLMMLPIFVKPPAQFF